MAVQVFQCNWGSSLKSFLSAKSQDKLYLQVDTTKPDDVKIKVKGYVCNEDGKNEYIAESDITAKDIRDVHKGEFQGSNALIIVTRLQTLYGVKKTQNILPGLKDMDKAIELLTDVATKAGGIGGDGKAAAAAPAPAAAPAAAPAPAPAAAKPAPKPAAAPAPAPVPAPAAAAPAPAPVPAAAVPAPAAAPAPAPAPTPVVPAYTPSQTAAAATAAVPAAEAPAPAPAPAAEPKKTETYEQKLRKLDVIHESGMCSDEEYKEKKLKLLCDEKGMGAFYEKIQKLFVVKRSGVMSEEEFAANKNQIVDACFDPSVTDLNQFRENTSRLPIILMSELVSEAEYNAKKEALLESVAYNPLDDNELFTLKLQKIPVLVEAELVPKEEFESDKKELKELLDPTLSDSIDALDMKLARWPAMVVAGTASEDEYKERQSRLITQVMAMPAGDEEGFKNKVERVMKLKERGWLSEMDFHGKKVEILKEVEGIGDVVQRTRLNMLARDLGLISDEDFEVKKQALIKDIFAPYENMDQFQEKVTLLKNLNDGGIITAEEFNSYKSKLMSDL